jgi:uncharacterized MAPEG superfamily protein
MSAAYWCILVGALLPYLNAGIAKARSPYDNRFPRALERYQGMAFRAHGAHQNSFEVFPFFAIAVLVASGGSARLANHILNSLALAWIVGLGLDRFAACLYRGLSSGSAKRAEPDLDRRYRAQPRDFYHACIA